MKDFQQSEEMKKTNEPIPTQLHKMAEIKLLLAE